MPDEQALSVADYEVNALGILDTAKDYNSGMEELTKAYDSAKYDNQEEAKKTLADYGQSLRFKHKVENLSDDELLDVVKVKPEQAQGTDIIDRINSWEKLSLKSLQQEKDPNIIGASKDLTAHIKDYASRARRDINGNREPGAVSWAKDKFFRVAEGLLSPLSAFEATEEYSRALQERTDPKRDEDLSSKIASIAGGIAPAVAAAFVPGAQVTVPAIIAGQTVGGTKQTYKAAVEATGDTQKAFQAATVATAANAVGLIPFGKAALGLGTAVKAATTGELALSAFAKTMAKIKNPISIATDAVGFGVAGATAGILAKEAQRIGMDSDVNVTEDVLNDFIANAAVGGFLSSAHVLVDNFKIGALKRRYEKFEEDLQKASQKNQEEAAKTGEAPVAEKQYFQKDKDGYYVEVEEQPTIATRERDAKAEEKAKAEFIEEPYVDEPNVPKDEAGFPVDLPEKPNYEIPLEDNRFTLSKKFGELDDQVKSWDKKTTNKAYDALGAQKEVEYLTKRIQDLQKKAATGEEPASGAKFAEQIAEYQQALNEMLPRIAEDAPGVKEANIIKERKTVTEALKKYGPLGERIKAVPEESSEGLSGTEFTTGVLKELPPSAPRETVAEPRTETVAKVSTEPAKPVNKTEIAISKRLAKLEEQRQQLIKENQDTSKVDEEISFLQEETKRYAGKGKPVETEGDKFLESRGILLSANKGGLKPNAATVKLAQAIISQLKLSRNILDGALGVAKIFSDGRRTIEILRSMGAVPEQFTSTLAHEVGHVVRYHLEDLTKGGGAVTPTLKKFVEDWASFYKSLQPTWDAMVLKDQLKDASMEWREGWDGNTLDKYGRYRSSPEEMFADSFSYLVNAPDVFQVKHPELWAKFEEVLTQNKRLGDFWDNLQQMNGSPHGATSFSAKVQQEARSQQGEKNAAAIMKKREDNSPGLRLKNKLHDTYQTLFNSFNVVARYARAWPKEARNYFYDLYNTVQSGGAAYSHINKTLDVPLQKLFGKFQQSGLKQADWAQLEASNHIIHDETTTMFKVKADPEAYMEAAKLVKSFLVREKGMHLTTPDGLGVNDILDFSKITDGDSLNDALSKINFTADIAQVLKIEDFLANEDPSDPKALQKAKQKYSRAVNALAKRKISIPIENVRSRLEKLKATEDLSQDTIDKAREIMRENAFSARRYLVNPFGENVESSKLQLERIKNELGPKKFAELQDFSKQYHDILNDSMRPVVAQSGIFSPDMMMRMDLNSSTYVSFAALKHFTEDADIGATVRAAIGNIDAAGDPLVNTVLKTKAIIARAYQQRAVNAAVNFGIKQQALIESTTGKEQAKLLKAGNVKVEKVAVPSKSNIFGERDNRSSRDPDHSYLVAAHNGEYSLYKISDGKGYENMFKKFHTVPVAEPLIYMTDLLSKMFLVRQVKTTLNPTFSYRQKIYDRKMEALMYNSLYPTAPIIPMHLDPALIKMEKAVIAEREHYNKTGEWTGDTKKLLDLDGAALDEAMFIKEGVEPAENMLYEMAGNKMPMEGNALERIGIVADKVAQKYIGNFWDTITFDTAGPKAAARDEFRTKVMGFKIGKSKGMTDAQAAVYARENFGIPDPQGGGRGASQLNRVLLFGRAHFNGLRTLARYVRDTPLKTSMAQIAMRIVAPKIPMIAGIMVPAIAATLGKDAAEVYKKAIEFTPSVDKLNVNPIPMGWQDGQGKFHSLFSVKAEDIQADWKVWNIRLPQSREITAMTKVMWPFITNMAEAEPTKAVAEATKGTGSVVSGNLQPMIQYATNLLEMTAGRNPTDFFRMKGIFSKDLEESGSVGEKLLEYGKYAGASHFPSAIPYNPFATTEPIGTGEKIQQNIPFAGPIFRSLIGISNYGAMEASKEGQEQILARNAGIRRSTDTNTQKLLAEYRKSMGVVNTLGKGWEKKVGRDVANRTHYLISWHTRLWQKYQDALSRALTDNDMERYQYLLNQVADSSEGILEKVQSMPSSFEEEKEQNTSPAQR